MNNDWLKKDYEGKGKLIQASLVPVGSVCMRPRGVKSFTIKHVSKTHLTQNWIYTCVYPDVTTECPLNQVYLIELPKNEEENIMAKALHQVKGTEIYGYPLAVNSAGKMVFEVKGSGDILTVAKSEIEKVMPYTISVVFMNTPSKTYHYFNEKRNLRVNDIVYIEGGSAPARVTGIDTKNELANKEITGIRMVGDKI